MELFKFPMKTLNISQGYGYSVDGVSAFNFSHKGKKALNAQEKDDRKRKII